MRSSPFSGKIKRLFSVCLGLSVLITLLLPVSVSAAESQVRTVRVGFFAFEGYHEIDNSGRMSGYGYDFLTLMKRYANVQYEYVGYDKSWDAMLEMLRSGEIDMVTSAHKTEDRLEEFDFSVPIGENCVQLKCRADDDSYTAGLFDTYNGMTIGLVQGSSVNAAVEEFAQENGFSYTAGYYADSTQLKDALSSGEIDAVATSSLRKSTGEKVLSEFDTEYFYAMVRKGDTELLDLINDAVSQMDASEGDWKHTLYYNNYTAANHTDLVFTQEEKDYIAAHSAGGDKVIVAADNAWAPFVSKENGIYVGIIPDYIDRIININHQLQRTSDMKYVIEATKTNAGTRKLPMTDDVYRCFQSKTLQYLMGHSDIGVTMNTYTHLGLDDAKDEMIRLQELEDARKEVEKTTEKPKVATQAMFRAV